MKPSEILREAARLVEGSPGPDMCGCYAIALVAGTLRHGDWPYPYHIPEDVLRHFHMVAPYKRASTTLRRWWQGYGEKDERIIGLCLAAAIAESEGQ